MCATRAINTVIAETCTLSSAALLKECHSEEVALEVSRESFRDGVSDVD
jgi:hypothetical protein